MLISLDAGSHHNQRSWAGSCQQFASINFLCPDKSFSFYNCCHPHCASCKRDYMDYELSLAFFWIQRFCMSTEEIGLCFIWPSECFAPSHVTSKLLACCHMPLFRSGFLLATQTHRIWLVLYWLLSHYQLQTLRTVHMDAADSRYVTLLLHDQHLKPLGHLDAMCFKLFKVQSGVVYKLFYNLPGHSQRSDIRTYIYIHFGCLFVQ